MANTNPIRFTETMHIRVDPEFLADLDDLRTIRRPVMTRAEMIRELVREAVVRTADRRMRKGK